MTRGRPHPRFVCTASRAVNFFSSRALQAPKIRSLDAQASSRALGSFADATLSRVARLLYPELASLAHSQINLQASCTTTPCARALAVIVSLALQLTTYASRLRRLYILPSQTEQTTVGRSTGSIIWTVALAGGLSTS